MKVDCHLGIVNKVESRLGYFGSPPERKGVRSALALFPGVLCIEGQ
ncbi:MAG TPA: hypothetical protein VLH17_00030 [Candidatus Binatia bacterium]|nr:hypothetical protein [Candidatus Binatia bacterium]